MFLLLRYVHRFPFPKVFSNSHRFFMEGGVNGGNFEYSLPVSVLFAWAFFVLLVVLSPIRSTNVSLRIFNPRNALTALFRVRSPTEQRLAFLDLFRVWAICWVISNHLGSEGRLDTLLGLPHGDLFKQSIHAHPFLGPVFGNSALGVEIFLVLSGLLAARSWHRRWQFHLGFWRNSIKFYLHRWLRLAPTTLAFVLLATGSSRRALPLFHHTMASNCTNAQFIAHALLLSNWSRPTCFSYLWHLGLDWQCHLLVPFLLHFLSRHRRAGLSLMIALIIGSMFLRAFKCVSNGICNKSDVDIPFFSVSVRPDYEPLHEMYTRPTTKCGPFLVGLLIGLVTLRADNSPSSEWIKMLRLQHKTIFWVGVCVAVGCVYGILPQYWYPDQGTTPYNTLYTAIFRTLFASGVGAMIIGCLFSVKSFAPLTQRLWTVLARLTFSTALTHMPVVFFFTHIAAFQESMSPFGLLVALPPAVLMSFVVATIFHCFVQWPVSQIISHVTKN